MNAELVRFIAKFERGTYDECWPWLAYITHAGYGQFQNSLDGNNTAHRYALILKVGLPPRPEMQACHSCDNRACVNPTHLRWGTRLDNADDARRRGRIPLGEERPNARLTRVAVAEIKTRLRAGESGVAIAHEFRVHPNTIYSIRSGQSWRHVA